MLYEMSTEALSAEFTNLFMSGATDRKTMKRMRAIAEVLREREALTTTLAESGRQFLKVA